MCVCWGRGAAPPIIKLVCCAGGPCLRGRRSSFLHSVETAGEALSLSSVSGYFCNSSLTALRLADLHEDKTGVKKQQQHLPNPSLLPPSLRPFPLPAQSWTSSPPISPPPPLPSCATVSTWPFPTGTLPPLGRVGIVIFTLSALLPPLFFLRMT